MDFEVDPLTREALAATATAYTQDADIDVVDRLRAELDARGRPVTDRAWLEDRAVEIRSGHSIEEVPPPRAGSPGDEDGGS